MSTTDADRLWRQMLDASEELGDELDLEGRFTPRALAAVDGWVSAHEGRLDERDATRLALLLARVLVETHGGGFERIVMRGHPLDGEWTVSGFTQGLAADYHVPFVVSAARIAIDRELTALAWYSQVLDEGR